MTAPTVVPPSHLAVLITQPILLLVHIIFFAARTWILRHRTRSRTWFLSDSFYVLFIILSGISWIINYYKICDDFNASKYMDKENLDHYMYRKAQLKLFFWMTLTYFTSMLALKAAWLLLYHSISIRLSKKLRITLHIMSFVVVVFYGAAIIYSLAWCQPIANFWTEGSYGSAKCKPSQLNFRVLTVQFYSNVITNILIMIFPLFLLRHLQLGSPERYGLVFVFFCGLISIGVSATNYGIVAQLIAHGEPFGVGDVRLQLVLFADEIVAANITFCLPAFRVLVPRTNRGLLERGTWWNRSARSVVAGKGFTSSSSGFFRKGFAGLGGRKLAAGDGQQIFVNHDFEIHVASEVELCSIDRAVEKPRPTVAKDAVEAEIEEFYARSEEGGSEHHSARVEQLDLPYGMEPEPDLPYGLEGR